MKIQMSLKRLLLILVMAMLLAACDSGLAFRIAYEDVDSLRKGAPLVHHGSKVGLVQEIEYTDQGDFLVSVNVQEQYTDLMDQASVFYISDDEHLGIKVIEIVDGVSGESSPIKDDQIIEGSSRFTGMAQKFQNQFDDTLTSLTDSLKNSVSDWNKQTLEQQKAYVEEELDRLYVEFQNLSDATRHQIETSIIPKLKEQVAILKQKLEALGREDELEAIEGKMDSLNELIEA